MDLKSDRFASQCLAENLHRRLKLSDHEPILFAISPERLSVKKYLVEGIHGSEPLLALFSLIFASIGRVVVKCDAQCRLKISIEFCI